MGNTEDPEESDFDAEDDADTRIQKLQERLRPLAYLRHSAIVDPDLVDEWEAAEKEETVSGDREGVAARLKALLDRARQEEEKVR